MRIQRQTYVTKENNENITCQHGIHFQGFFAKKRKAKEEANDQIIKPT